MFNFRCNQFHAIAQLKYKDGKKYPAKGIFKRTTELNKNGRMINLVKRIFYQQVGRHGSEMQFTNLLKRRVLRKTIKNFIAKK
jgi:hypothetical protein